MNEMKFKRILFYTAILISIPYKLFFIYYQDVQFGPDALEYIYLKGLFNKLGLINYITSSDPLTFWRLPLLPYLLYLCKLNFLFFSFQMFLSYFLSFNIYKIIFKLTNKHKSSLFAAIIVLFLPYINIAAASTLSEFLQVFLIIYIFRKDLYKEYDAFFFFANSAVILLRPEMYTFVLLLFVKNIIFNRGRYLIYFCFPLLVAISWMYRNKVEFGNFTLVNPILSSRAIIGSIYGKIYMAEPHPFHDKYDYYQGKDYIHNIGFINEYKNVVSHEFTSYIKRNPIKFILHRIKMITYGFSLVAFNMERLPDEHWKFYSGDNRAMITTTNATWAYSYLIKHHQYFKLFLRLLYHSNYLFFHFLGLIFILLNYKKLYPIIFIFISFGYVFLVEVDMRYLITLQVLCYSFGVVALINLIKYHHLYLAPDSFSPNSSQ